MCYEERYFNRWATKKERQHTEPAARDQRPAAHEPPGGSTPKTEKPRQPEPELEPV